MRACRHAPDSGRWKRWTGGGRTLDLEDRWRYACPKSPMWNSEDEAWSGDESVSSGVRRENHVCNGALHVIGLYGPGDKISLLLKSLRGWRQVITLPWKKLCQAMREAWCLGGSCQRNLCVTARQAFLSPWMGCDTKRRRDVVRAKIGRRNVSDKPFELSWLV